VTSGFHLALAAAERSPEIPVSRDVYGWLIGSWELEVVHYRVDVSARGLRAVAHFGWVLEGRAVQDVWIMPPRPPGNWCPGSAGIPAGIIVSRNLTFALTDSDVALETGAILHL
jgi:hypothetical protein